MTLVQWALTLSSLNAFHNCQLLRGMWVPRKTVLQIQDYVSQKGMGWG